MDGLQGCSLWLDLDAEPKKGRYPVVALYKGEKESSGVYLKIEDWDNDLCEPKRAITDYGLKVCQIQLACRRLSHRVSIGELSKGTNLGTDWIEEPEFSVDENEEEVHEAKNVVALTDRFHELTNSNVCQYPQVPMYIQETSFVADCTHCIDMGGYQYRPNLKPLLQPMSLSNCWNSVVIKDYTTEAIKSTPKEERKRTKTTTVKPLEQTDCPKNNHLPINIDAYWSDKDGFIGGREKVKTLFRLSGIPMIYPVLFKSKLLKSGGHPVLVVYSHKGKRKTLATGISLQNNQWDHRYARPLRDLPDYDTLMCKIGQTMREVANLVKIGWE